MHYVLFSGIVPASKAAVGAEYYGTLQPILQNISGFIEEVPFGDPTQPHRQCLFAQFTDAAALARWRNHPTHLRVMHDARQNVFDEFRIVVGTDNDDAAAAAERIVNIYQRPVRTTEPGEDLKRLVDGVEKTAAGKTPESKFYVGEKLLMWVSRPKGGSSVEEFEASLERVPGDAVYRVRVVREYSKGDRREAPVGIDGAEAMAGA
ncbi:hypothetical protein M409DRAFT_20317 [Zasmidium cellare ATCC 36951]|uniref:ABM domain-containing protein n=1 Tax=Zasmidium cellare ATCC 36951 TaxID=1080233 RepID=A0A6A6CRX5_ZASCE|nr:uncharacterized protein M409DRAFT_20317 [Zasmidium cellare ATCC 36951]KAF2169904.1 hypothetical protein M409DRAFT_20317 [Zasmidium cellare ATCC 36951]